MGMRRIDFYTKNMPKSRLIYAVILSAIISVLSYTMLGHIIAYQQMDTLFIFSAEYWSSTLSLIGGFGLYATSFVTQFFYYPLLGAIIIGLLYGLAYYILASCTKLSVVVLIPLLYLFMGYVEAQFMIATVAIILNIIALGLWRMLPQRWQAYTAPLGAVLLYVATGVVALLFVVMMSVMIIKVRKQWIALLVLLAVAAVTPFVAAHIYAVSTHAALVAGTNDVQIFDTTFITIWALVALAALLLPATLFNKLRWLRPVLFALTLLIFGYQFYKNFNFKLRSVMRIEQAAYDEDWSTVLQSSAQSQTKSLITTYMTNIALSRTGQLAQSLFDYPQYFGAQGLFFVWNGENSISIKMGDLVFANVGMVCEAHRWAFESMVNRGHNSYNFRKIVTYNRAMGREKVARKYEAILQNSLFYSSKTVLDFTPFQLSVCPDSVFTINQDLGYNLENVVRADSTNNAALDYLASYYLLSNQLQKFAAIYPQLLIRHNGKLPHTYHQALIVYYTAASPEQIASLGYTPPTQIYTSYNKFIQAYSSNSANAKASLENAFGKTYWYYLSFYSPNGLKIF